MIALYLLLAADAAGLLQKTMDPKLTIAQRNDACFALRGESTPEVRQAMTEMLADESVRACAARNLVTVQAKAELMAATANPQAEARAAALLALGELNAPETIPLIQKLARDPSPLVGLGAMNALAAIRSPKVIPALIELARGDDPIGLMALEQALPSRDPQVLAIARERLQGAGIPSKLTALQVLSDMGDRSDIAALRPLAAKDAPLNTGGRGFGFMPSINLARVAQATIAKIEARVPAAR